MERFVLQDKVGEGGFGQVRSAYDNETGAIVAIKMEAKKKNATEHTNRSSRSQLLNEIEIYKLLKPNPIFPWGEKVIINDQVCLAMEKLGPNIEEVYRQDSQIFDANTIARIAIRGIESLCGLHAVGYVHRDVKPQNFLFESDPFEDNNITTANNVRLIDFGLCKKYMKYEMNQHIDFQDHKGFNGTARYCSVNVHLGIEPSRRDDMISLGYVLAFMILGHFPWQNLLPQADRDNKKYGYYLIMVEKMKNSMEKLIMQQSNQQPKWLIDAIILYHNYVSTLRFAETPNYTYCIELFSRHHHETRDEEEEEQEEQEDNDDDDNDDDDHSG